MDVHCSTCGEPWDTQYLREDAIYETDLSEEEVKQWQGLPSEEQLSPSYRARFQAARWEFGFTMMNVVRCSACPRDTKPIPDVLHLKGEIEGMLGDDLDGIAATFEDFGL